MTRPTHDDLGNPTPHPEEGYFPVPPETEPLDCRHSTEGCADGERCFKCGWLVYPAIEEAR